MNEYKIEQGVPIPDINAGRKYKYPWYDLQAGDSFVVKPTDNVLAARVAALRYAKRHGMVFITRMSNKGLRVWRVK